jgi:hypothetical protein
MFDARHGDKLSQGTDSLPTGDVTRPVNAVGE